MISKTQIESFIEVLKTEVSKITDESLNIEIKEEEINLNIKDYKSILHFSLEKNEASLICLEQTFEEKDILDGLVRLRFQLIKYLLPDLF